MSHLRRVEVEWTDSTATPGWMPRTQAMLKRPIPALSVGLLVHEDEGCVVLAQSHEMNEDQVADLCVIPRSQLHHVRYLEPVDEARTSEGR